jgi:adenylate cyclase
MSFHLVDAQGTRLAGLPAGGSLVVGRSAECALVLADPTVSRRHAEVHAADDHLVVMDLGSRNGTFRNGVRVERARLRPGDVVAFGVVPLRVEAEADAELALVAPDARAPMPTAGGTSVLGQESAPVPLAPERSADGEPSLSRRHTPSADAPAPLPPAPAAPPRIERPATPAAPPGGDWDAEPPIVAEREAASPQELTARRLQQLLEATKALGGAADVNTVHERIVGATLRTLDADRAAILLVGDGNGDAALAPVVARDRWGADLIAAGAPPVPRTITRAALSRRAALLTVDATADPRFVGQSVLRQRVRSAMCVPLLAADGGALGALYVDSADPHRQFAEADLDFLTAFGGLAAASLENARLAERVRREAIARENFARYFAPPVAERIARSSDGVKLGGDRRTVAVLFADLRGSTKLAAELAPDDLAATLSEFLSGMVECVFRFGGTLDKFIGDCVMAQWGAPESTGDDADRALAAAIDMIATVEAMNARRQALGRPPLAIGIGLSHGEVFAGNIGSERRLEFTVIGYVVNQASRLCDVAAAGEILLTAPLRDALRGPPPRMREAPEACPPAGPDDPGLAVYAVARGG